MAGTLIVAFLTVAASAFGWSLYQYAGLDIALAAMSASVLLLFVLAIQNAIVRARQMRELEEDMETLRASNRSMSAALGDARKGVAEVALSIATKSDASEKKLANELKMIERLVRDMAQRIDIEPATPAANIATAPASSADRATPTDPAMLEIIRRSLEENRVDLYLQPVVGLPQRKVRYYEALSRLRSADGTIIMPAQYIRVAAPAGLMSVVDNLLLFRCVQVVRRLAQKQRDIGVFCNISGHTLRDTEFFPRFLDFMHHHRDLTSQIIFEFSQASVLSASPQEQGNLRYLANLGFRLSMDQVTKLDFDFANLKKLGFQFIKLRADTLLNGMKKAGARVMPEDFKDMLARNGLSLIAERIESEKTVVQLLEYNVDFGQGYLFGEPKALREIAGASDARTAQAYNISALPAGLARRLAG